MEQLPFFEHSETPEADRKQAARLAVLLAFFACIAFALSVALPSARIALQLLGFLLLTALLFVFLKCFSFTYTYTLTAAYHTPLLLVTQAQGKRVSTLASFAVTEIVAEKEVSTAEEIAAMRQSFRSCGIRYSYTASLLPKRLQLLTLCHEGRTVHVLLEASERFLPQLRAMRSAVLQADGDA